MAHQRTQPATPDLFSTELVQNAVPAQVPPTKEATRKVSQRHVLPQDLPNEVKYLTDAELDLLIATAVDEAKRRGRLTPMVDRMHGTSQSGHQRPPAELNYQRAH